MLEGGRGSSPLEGGHGRGQAAEEGEAQEVQAGASPHPGGEQRQEGQDPGPGGAAVPRGPGPDLPRHGARLCRGSAGDARQAPQLGAPCGGGGP